MAQHEGQDPVAVAASPTPAPPLPPPRNALLTRLDGAQCWQGDELTLAGIAFLSPGGVLGRNSSADGKPLPPTLNVPYGTFATPAWVIHSYCPRWRAQD